MSAQDKNVKALVDEVTSQVVGDLKSTIGSAMVDSMVAAVEKEVAARLTRTLMDGEFYRRMSLDMKDGFKDIYDEIKAARGEGAPAPKKAKLPKGADDPSALFSKASDQLDAVLQTTEQAAVEIIDIVEKLQEMHTVVAKIVKGFESGGVTRMDREKLKEINTTLSSDLSRIMVTMSFQDLTGQRIKIIIESLRKIENIVQTVLVSTGLMMKSRQEEPEKDIEQIEKEARTQATALTGPSLDTNQSDVDDLLAQFGM